MIAARSNEHVQTDVDFFLKAWLLCRMWHGQSRVPPGVIGTSKSANLLDTEAFIPSKTSRECYVQDDDVKPSTLSHIQPLMNIFGSRI